jgi:protein SCO1
MCAERVPNGTLSFDMDFMAEPLYKNSMTRNQRILLVFFSTLVLIGLFAAYEYTKYRKFGPTSPSSPEILHPVTDDSFSGPFEMVDHNHKPVNEKSWPGKYRLIYFGFTYCPAICPTELQKMTLALKALGDQAAIIQPLFFTVDPERDTAAKLKEYVTLFHPSLIGVTGMQEQTEATLKAFKIYAAKVKQDGMSDYTMDHSSFIYFIAPDGRLLHIFKTEDNADIMTKTIQQWLAQEQLQ